MTDSEPSLAKAVFYDVAMRLIRLASPRPQTPHLPDELIRQIFELIFDAKALYHGHIAELGPTFKAWYAELRSFALVNRMWSSTASDLLLRHVFLDTNANADLWRFNPRGIVPPVSMVLAGTVTMDRATACVRHCGPRTLHLGLHICDPFPVELLFMDHVAGLKSLTIGGPFRNDLALSATDGLHFVLDHLAVHGYGIPLVLLGSLIPETALLTGAEVYPLVEEGVALSEPDASTTWTLRHTRTVVPSHTDAHALSAILPQPDPPTAGVPLLRYQTPGQRVVKYDIGECRFVCVELPVSYRFAGLVERCLPTLKMLSTTGYATPDFDDARSDTFGSMWISDFRSTNTIAQFHEPKIKKPVVVEPGTISRLANEASHVATEVVIGLPGLWRDLLGELRYRLS